jgi:hypothetical protein
MNHDDDRFIFLLGAGLFAIAMAACMAWGNSRHADQWRADRLAAQQIGKLGP